MSAKAVFSVAVVAVTYLTLIRKTEPPPFYKITYFSVPVLGEPIRFLLSYGNFDFEDNRLQKEDWPALKPSMPFGQVPVLELDGKVAHQSLAICRYLGKQVNLVGYTDWEDLEIDAAADTINDLRLKIGQAARESDPTIKAQKMENVFNEVVPYYVTKLEEQVKKNNGFLAAGKLTWADIYYAALFEYMNQMLGFDMTQNAPNLRGVKEKVYDLPQIKEWLAKRPKTNF